MEDVYPRVPETDIRELYLKEAGLGRIAYFPGVIDVTVWQQADSMTVHLVNLTNPMMMKGPFRELIPVDEQVSIKIPQGTKVKDVKMLVSEQKIDFKNNNGKLALNVQQILDHEIIGIDLI